jgi:hypothetical protein
MKRSKIFLGATTALLAVAGVAAAKHYSHSKQLFYLSAGGNYCYAASVACTKSGSQVCFYETAGGKSVVVFTKGPAGPKQLNVNCLSQFRYNGDE